MFVFSEQTALQDAKLDAARLPVEVSRRIAAARAAHDGVASPVGALCAPDDPVLLASLARFTLLRIRTPAQLVAACFALDAVLEKVERQQGAAAGEQQRPPLEGLLAQPGGQPHAHAQGQSTHRLVCVDNVAAFAWLQKQARAPSAPPPPPGSFPPAPPPAPKRAVLNARNVDEALSRALKGVAQRRKLAVLASRHGYGRPPPPAAAGHAGPAYRENMSPSWRELLTHRLTLYAPEMGGARVCAHWLQPVSCAAGDFIAG